MKKVICKDVFGEEYEVDVNDLVQKVAVYAIIIEDNKILLTQQWDGYSIVGGGVDKGEILADAFSREAKEETGPDVTIGDLIYHTTTFFKKNSESTPHQAHQFYFTHKNLDGEISNSDITESERGYTIGTPKWVELNDIDSIKFRHSVNLRTLLDAYNRLINDLTQR
jgi:8-oxo-dGTP diphosphatase